MHSFPGPLAPIPHSTIYKLAHTALSRLASSNPRPHTLSIAESLTGGLVSSVVTDLPGASRVLRSSVVAYSNDAKMNILRVPRTIFEGPDSVGPVSSQCAEAMAVGVKTVCGTDWGISTTGWAGGNAIVNGWTVPSIQHRSEALLPPSSKLSTSTSSLQNQNPISSSSSSSESSVANNTFLHAPTSTTVHNQVDGNDALNEEISRSASPLYYDHPEIEGLVFVHVAGPNGISIGRKLVLDGNRWDKRWKAVEQALELLIEAVEAHG
ncbi:hypothetical protein HDU76_003035 [Blyttiomyces sp. JEL0837]|nr:hypothetical protein HDU76_003035 [Blyttiomyces sp. JEL0837]